MTAQPNLTVETVDIATLTPDPTNARKHDRRNLDSIAGSLRQFGQRKPIVVTAAGTVLAGNGTLAAARELGWSEIAVVRTPADWDDDRAKAYALADNRTAELAAWDDEVLGAQLIALDNAGWDLAEIGFDRADQASQIEDTEDDEVPAPPAEPRAKLGDVWQIGPHRIVCGDSLDKATLDKAFGDVTIGCVLTDPPYGMDLNTDFKIMHHKTSGSYKPVIGDDRPFNPNFHLDYFVTVKEQWWWGADYYRAHLPEGGSWLVWDKRFHETMQLEKVHGNHFELAWSRQNHKRIVLRFLWAGHHGMQSEDTKARVHPTQKPTAMLIDILKRWTSDGCVVADPFAGSGATLVAAARTGRIGRGVELDPGYVDVIVGRLEAETGLTAELVTDGSAG